MSGEPRRLTSLDEWLRRLKTGERRALAQLLSCAESTRPDDERFVEQVLAVAGAKPRGIRIGVTGIPGAGKSSLIDALGAHYVALGKRVAVLAVDPSSPISGGSILGDKLRMPQLVNNEAAFVRPLANGGMSGGGIYALDDCVRLCELAGYDVVMAESVGVGQNETDVGLVCDVTLLVVVPGTGDEVQALKRGIMEVVDIVAVNKSDLASKAVLDAVVQQYRVGSSYSRAPALPVVACSATQGAGVHALATELVSLAAAGATDLERGHKRQLLLRRLLEQALLRRLWAELPQKPEFTELNHALVGGRLNVRQALSRALELTENVLGHHTCPPDQG